MDSYSTLPWVTWEAVSGVEGIPWCYFYTRWLTGLRSTQAKVEGIIPRAVWHWGSDSSVINNPLEEPGCTLLYVGLLYAWGSMDGDCFPRNLWEGSLLGTQIDTTDINEWIKRQAWKMILSPSTAIKAQSLSFNRTHSRVIIGLLTGHNTLRRHLYNGAELQPHL